MIFYLIFLLSALFFVESSTSLARKSGYSEGNAASGLILQSSLGLVSRALIFMFMPLIGLAADKGNLLESKSDILLSYSMIPMTLLILVVCREYVEWIYKALILRMSVSGSYFRSSNTKKKFKKGKLNYLKKAKCFYKLYLLVIFAYIPYYVSWPFIIYLLDIFPERRGFILGMSSVFNGINTIVLTLIVDPKLAQLGRYKRIILSVYGDFILLRLFASIFSFAFLMLIIASV